MARPAPEPVLNWTRAQSGTGFDGTFALGVFQVRRRLGHYHVAFIPAEDFASLLCTPEDHAAKDRWLRWRYESERVAMIAAEGLAVAFLERVPQSATLGSGDFVVDSIVTLLRSSGQKWSKQDILSKLGFSEGQWLRFLAERERFPDIHTESHGRGAVWHSRAAKPASAAPTVTRNKRQMSFADYIGQRPVIERVRSYVAAAKQSGRALGHILLTGPSGTGKTTLAQCVAHELGRPLHEQWGPSFDVAALRAVRPLDILFVDEIHSLSPTQQEQLFDVMASGATVIGATTFPGRLTGALLSRFGITETLEVYGPEDLATIIRGVATRDGVKVSEAVIGVIAKRSRGVARTAIHNWAKVRDLQGLGSEADALTAFRRLEIDDLGLTRQDRKYLRALSEAADPQGIDTLATILGESAETIESTIEPFLLQSGLIERTQRGRRITDKGIAHLRAQDAPSGQAQDAPSGQAQDTPPGQAQDTPPGQAQDTPPGQTKSAPRAKRSRQRKGKQSQGEMEFPQ